MGEFQQKEMDAPTPGEGSSAAATASDSAEIRLSVIIPAYNEEERIGATLHKWREVLEKLPDLEGHWECRVYNDGSTDGTAALLDEHAAADGRFVATHQENRGHGPTIMRGYREARGAWIFQADADSEVPPREFIRFWMRRGDYDLIIGSRSDRNQSLARRTFSTGARVLNALLFPTPLGAATSTPQDVNCPFRLWRRETLHGFLEKLQKPVFAPNVILTGLAVKNRSHILETEVTHKPTRDAPTRLGNPARLALLAMRNAWELWSTALEMPEYAPGSNPADQSRFRWLRLALFLIVVPGSCMVWLPLFFIWDSSDPWTFGKYGYLGFVPLLLGCALFFWSVLDFLTRGQGTPAPYEPPRRLVIAGPYRWSRNPMYVGVMLVALGEFFLFPSAGFAWYLISLLFFFNLGVRFYEEPNLKRRFGRDFITYCKQVPRWLFIN